METPHIRSASAELKDLVFAAVDHAMAMLQKHKTTLQPYALINNDSKTVIQLFHPEDLSQGVEMFEKTIAQIAEKPDRLVFCSDGFISNGETRFDAVLVRAYEKTDKHFYLLAQRYKHAIEGNEFEVIGNPVFLEAPVNVLTFNK
jgi:hypothetical protein